VNRRRSIELAVGVALLCFALVAVAVLFALIYYAAQADAVMPQGTEFWSLPRIVRRVGYLTLLLLVAYLALCLMEGRHITVLYLRRFRLNVTAISPTDAGGLGRRVRLFTLHDGHFVPSEVPLLDRWISRLAPIVALVAVISAGK